MALHRPCHGLFWQCFQMKYFEEEKWLYSNFFLSLNVLDHDLITRCLGGKKTYTMWNVKICKSVKIIYIAWASLAGLTSFTFKLQQIQISRVSQSSRDSLVEGRKLKPGTRFERMNHYLFEHWCYIQGAKSCGVWRLYRRMPPKWPVSCVNLDYANGPFGQTLPLDVNVKLLF